MQESNTGVAIGYSENSKTMQHLSLRMANRHGLIVGATGTGKTITLQGIAEQFIHSGVPVFLTDIKGDLSGIAASGKTNKEIERRFGIFGLKTESSFFKPCSAVFWDVYGKNGTPFTTTVTEMGPDILARLFDSNNIQTDTLKIAFQIAQKNKWDLVSFEHLKQVINYMRDHRKELERDYGNISSSTLGAIQRDIMSFISSGMDRIFGKPSLNLDDLLQKKDGKSVAHILDATELSQNSAHYASILLTFLNKLYAHFPESGDQDQPKLAVFFDEAHMIFKDAPEDLIEKMEGVIRLIRSKGVSIFFITQSPNDIPETIQSQIGNRVIHGLRGFNKSERLSIKDIAASLPVDDGSSLDIAETIPNLGVGESIVSLLNDKGTPNAATRILNMCPSSQIGPIDLANRHEMNKEWQMYSFYRERTKISALEIKSATDKVEKTESKTEKKTKRSTRQTAGETFLKSILRKLATAIVSLLTLFAKDFARKKIRGGRRSR